MTELNTLNELDASQSALLRTAVDPHRAWLDACNGVGTPLPDGFGTPLQFAFRCEG